MTKKEYCQKNPPIAYYSGFDGLEIHGIGYGIDDYIYCVSGAWGPPSGYKYHRLKIYHDPERGGFFRLHGYKCYLDDCVRMGGF